MIQKKKVSFSLISHYSSTIALRVKNEYKSKSIEGYKFEIDFCHRETIIVIQHVHKEATVGDLVNAFAKFGESTTPRIKERREFNVATIQFLDERSVDLAIHEVWKDIIEHFRQ
jgi:hypothetical protein